MSYHPMFLVAALVALFSVAPLSAQAAERQVYDAGALAAAQKAGKPIVVHVTAPWCPTCKAQAPILEKLASQPDFADVVFFELDFDTGGQALRALNVRSQSTLIVFKGERETGRSAGDTNADSIANLVKTAF